MSKQQISPEDFNFYSLIGEKVFTVLWDSKEKDVKIIFESGKEIFLNYQIPQEPYINFSVPKHDAISQSTEVKEK